MIAATISISGSTVAAGAAVTYSVDIFNTGTAPAYDVVLRDIIPMGMRAGGITMVNTYLLSGGSSPGLVNLPPVYNAATGNASWNFDTGIYTIPVGDTLRVVYRVTVDSNVAPGLTLTNAAQVASYYSFDDANAPTMGGITGIREAYGLTDTAATTLYTGAPPTKALVSPATAEATIGQSVVYQIRVPGTVSTRPLYDVQITDTLDTNLEYLGFTQISGPAVTDNSAAPNLLFSVAQIPAGQQVVIELSARVRNVIDVQQGVAIDNVASYTYVNAAGGTVQPALTSGTVTVSIVEPHVATIVKSPSVTTPTAGETMRYSVTLTASGGTYSTDVFDATVTDTLGAGLVYAGNPAVSVGDGVGADNTLGAPVVIGDGSPGARDRPISGCLA